MPRRAGTNKNVQISAAVKAAGRAVATAAARIGAMRGHLALRKKMGEEAQVSASLKAAGKAIATAAALAARMKGMHGGSNKTRKNNRK